LLPANTARRERARRLAEQTPKYLRTAGVSRSKDRAPQPSARIPAIMPPKANTHFLGIQLAVDHLRAAVVDEQLEVVGADQIDFDTDFPEYQ
jgi:hypothetical protein